MFALLTILIVLLGFYIHSNKKYTAVMLSWMWILFAFNTMNGDYIPYTKIFSHISNNNAVVMQQYEKGFVFLCYLFGHILHLSYNQFIIIIATICIVLFAIVIFLYCRNGHQNMVISMFMILLYWMMICQYRVFIAMLFLLLGLYFMENVEGKRGYILYLVFLLLGVLFHSAIALFILLIFAKKFNRKIIFILIPAFLLLTVLLKSEFIVTIASRFVPVYKIQRWLMYETGTRSWMGYFMVLFSRTSIPILEQYSYKVDLSRTFRDRSSYMAMQEYIIKISFICLAFVPMEMAITDYERLARLPLFLSIIYIASVISQRRLTIHKVSLDVFLFFIFYLIYGWMYFVSYNGWIYHNLIPILTNNMLIEWIGF